MQYYCGIDIGASAAKLVLIDRQRQVVAKSVRRSGIDYSATAGECLPPTTAEDALWVHRILEAAYRASAERREVAVREGREEVDR